MKKQSLCNPIQDHRDLGWMKTNQSAALNHRQKKESAQLDNRVYKTTDEKQLSRFKLQKQFVNYSHSL